VILTTQKSCFLREMVSLLCLVNTQLSNAESVAWCMLIPVQRRKKSPTSTLSTIPGKRRQGKGVSSHAWQKHLKECIDFTCSIMKLVDSLSLVVLPAGPSWILVAAQAIDYLFSRKKDLMSTV